MIIDSILDSDLYKFSMQQAVCQLFPNAHAQYEFINRGGTKFPEGFAARLKSEINNMGALDLKDSEYKFLENIRFFNPVYLDFLSGYGFDSNDVTISEQDGDLRIKIKGPWYKTILWEVPLMAIISELYFNMTDQKTIGHLDIADVVKARALDSTGAPWADFGTRRRFSKENHDKVLKIFKESSSKFSGTSNVSFALKHGLKPIGTMAHEWMMFHAAKYGFMSANEMALENWVNVYQGDLGIALTDTFTTKDFFRIFNKKYAKLFDGVRHDSGDPLMFADRVIKHYKDLGIDPLTKTIVFSDGLDADKVETIEAHVNERINTSYGIGTNLTNDIGLTPLNMVVKMVAADPNGDGNWCETVKISDSPGKEVGSSVMVNACKTLLQVGE